MKKTWSRFIPLLILGGGLLVSFLLETPHINLKNIMSPPSFAHLLGTDILGRDIAVRIIINLRYSIGISLVIVCITAVIGTAASIISVCYRILSFPIIIFTTMAIVIPPFIVCLLFVSSIGNGTQALILGQFLAFIPVFYRLSYRELKTVMQSEYAQTTIGLGNSPLWVCVNHGLLILVPKLLAQMLSLLAVAIGIESGLSYLGLGPTLPDAGLGYMLQESISYWNIAPWYPLSTLLTFVLLLFIINIILQSKKLHRVS